MNIENSVDGMHIIPGTENDVLLRIGEEVDYKALEDASIATSVKLSETKAACRNAGACEAVQHDDAIGEPGNKLIATIRSSDVRCPLSSCPSALANLVDVTLDFES